MALKRKGSGDEGFRPMAVTGPKATHESRLSRVPAWAVLMIFAFGENGYSQGAWPPLDSRLARRFIPLLNSKKQFFPWQNCINASTIIVKQLQNPNSKFYVWVLELFGYI